MANTRSPKTNPGGLTAAAFPLVVTKNNDSLLYNSTVVDYMLNTSTAGGTAAAWSYYMRIPEVHYLVRYVANALSMATLYVGDASNNRGQVPTRLPKRHPANDLMADFSGGYAGQSELLDRLAVHLTVIGDSVIIGPRDGSSNEQPPFDQWRVFGSEEVHSRNGKIYVRFPGNSREVQIPDSTMAVRIWRPSPIFWYDSISPVKASFTVLKEIDLLDQHVIASAMSRLAGAGILGIPEELDLPNNDMETEGTEVDQFVAMLVSVMSAAIKDRGSASALVPIILRGPAEFISAIQHFDFTTEFSQQVPELRMGAIRRLALGMDTPPEILLGNSDSASWSAWQTDESTLRVHLIPMLQLIASSLTVGWLRPALEQLPLTDAQREQIPNLVVAFDVSNLKIRQDTSGDAQALYDRFEIDSEALRLATGFSSNSEPDNTELAKQILYKLVLTGDPALVAYAVEALRKNFGVTQLPELKAPEAAAAAEGTGPGRPPEGPPPATTEPGSPVPGERSQAKQLALPPIPKIGDQSNNAVK